MRRLSLAVSLTLRVDIVALQMLRETAKVKLVLIPANNISPCKPTDPSSTLTACTSRGYEERHDLGEW
jgi:hypothetical protein